MPRSVPDDRLQGQREADHPSPMTAAPPALPVRERITHRAVLSIAVPIMLSNVSTPLLGIVDTGVVGQVPEPTYIGAVALGALVFNFVFWGFGFLRMGTTGLTAQALGASDPNEIRASLGRAALIALAVGAALIALQWPIREIAFLPDRRQPASRGAGAQLLRHPHLGCARHLDELCAAGLVHRPGTRPHGADPAARAQCHEHGAGRAVRARARLGCSGRRPGNAARGGDRGHRGARDRGAASAPPRRPLGFRVPAGR